MPRAYLPEIIFSDYHRTKLCLYCFSEFQGKKLFSMFVKTDVTIYIILYVLEKGRSYMENLYSVYYIGPLKNKNKLI